MNADTPGNRCGGHPLLRSTDHARFLLRKAGIALAALAIPVAVVVGVVAAGPPAPAHSEAAAATASDTLRPLSAAPRSDAPGSAVSIARAEEIAEPGPDHRTAPDSTNMGRQAALTVLFMCWALLLLIGAIWRRRLAARDLRDWAEGWAEVEPRWSGRTV
jgi:hypothetical protein